MNLLTRRVMCYEPRRLLTYSQKHHYTGRGHGFQNARANVADTAEQVFRLLKTVTLTLS